MLSGLAHVPASPTLAGSVSASAISTTSPRCWPCMAWTTRQAAAVAVVRCVFSRCGCLPAVGLVDASQLSPTHQAPNQPNPLCRPVLQTSCDPTGGTYERWVHGRGLGDTATDQAGRAGEEVQGGHFQLYQPGHVTAGESAVPVLEGFGLVLRQAEWSLITLAILVLGVAGSAHAAGMPCLQHSQLAKRCCPACPCRADC